MKTKRLGIISSLALVAVLAACGDTKETETPNEQEEANLLQEEAETPPVVETEIKTEPVATTHETVPEPIKEKVKSTLPATSETMSKSAEGTQQPVEQPAPQKEFTVSSGEQAMDYLKSQIPEGENEDVVFGVDPELQTDEKGSYYFVRLSSLSLRLQGGTGTIGTYKVYQDGTYEAMY